MILNKQQSITLKLDPKEVEKRFLIRINSTFEHYTGNNVKLSVGEIERRENLSLKVTEREMAKELAKELGYEVYDRISINISMNSYWEDSDDGYGGHDVLRAYVSQIEITIILKNENNDKMKTGTEVMHEIGRLKGQEFDRDDLLTKHDIMAKIGVLEWVLGLDDVG